MPYAVGTCRGCGSDPEPHKTRCARCAKTRRQQEAARRARLLSEARCVVCGAAAAKVDGQPLTVCKTHREYYRARAAAG